MSNVTPEYCLDIINKFEVSEENKQNGVLGIDGEKYVWPHSTFLSSCFPTFIAGLLHNYIVTRAAQCVCVCSQTSSYHVGALFNGSMSTAR